MQGNDDEAWQAIVDNYGEVPVVPDDTVVAGPEPDPGPDLGSGAESEPGGPDAGAREAAFRDLDEDRFVPPVPPPLPRPSRDRAVAWAGVFGSPAVLLICLVLGIALPQLLAYLLVAGFVGGFCYLVWLMPRGPRDPYDDGAVV